MISPASKRTRVVLPDPFGPTRPEDAVAANVRFRYHVRDGTDLWLVYNHGLTTKRGSGVSAPSTTDRALIVKYSHTVSF